VPSAPWDLLVDNLCKRRSHRYIAAMAPPSMTVQARPAKTRVARAGTTALARGGDQGAVWETVRFGDVTITAKRPSDAEIQRNVEESSRALARALPRLARPGVRIYPKKDVPLYWCDQDDPNIFIRRLNGKTQRGVFEDGQFKATD
jgi:hypothetical protein